MVIPDSPHNRYITTLDMNGLVGRMVVLPAPADKKAEILFVYGRHSSLERYWGLLECLNRFARVTAPDLPGFGGMDSFYTIGKKPTFNNFADYLAAFVKLRYRRKRLTIVGVSFGFAIATRMLQRYPELADKVTLVISLAGYTCADDLNISGKRYWLYQQFSSICSRRLLAPVLRRAVQHRQVLSCMYHNVRRSDRSSADIEKAEERGGFLSVEALLWRQNDMRTHAFTLKELLQFDNCRKRLLLPVWHVNISGDAHLDSRRIAEHLRVIFGKVRIVDAHVTRHFPVVVADQATAALLIPAKLRRVLSRLKA